ncbi:MFS transporter [Actinomadura sp. 3N407]|uniref:MFS transporter n=1 Tax=Actinomadura sp. 3N407 TaxID=3457423 RepID=UPI003FCC5BBF
MLIAVLIWAPGAPTPPRARGRLDATGALGLGTALVCLLLGVSEGAGWGWTSGTTLGLLAAAAALLPAWAWWELRTAEPLVDLRVTARRQVPFTNLASVLVGCAMYAQALIVMQLPQLPEATGYGLGLSMLAAGLWMAPSGLMMMAVSPLGAKLSAAAGPKVTLGAGSLVIALGYGSSTVLMGSTWGLLIVTVVCGAGVGLAYGAMPALIMSAVPSSETASANGFNTLMRSIGTTVSAAVVGAVLAEMTTSMGGHVLPSEAGFRAAMLFGCGVALLAAAVTLAIPGRPARPPAEHAAPRRAARPLRRLTAPPHGAVSRGGRPRPGPPGSAGWSSRRGCCRTGRRPTR